MTRRSWSERAYAALLRVYPEEFRRDFGRDMRDLFTDHLREARRARGWRGVVGLWLRTIPDLLFTGVHEHEDEMLQAIRQDARYAARMLRKNKIFTVVAVLVVAIGVGSVSTIFSVANAIVLRPIPSVTGAKDVYAIQRARRDNGKARSMSYPYYRAIASGSRAMTGIAAFDMMATAISTGGEATIVQSNLVTGNYFSVLGVRPALGRFFLPDEDAVVNAKPVVVISHDLWQRRFAGDSGVIGRSMRVNGSPFTIVGVAPERFRGLYPVLRIDTWIPMMMQPAVRRGGNLLASVGSGWLDVFGRLAPGVEMRTANAELETLTRRFSQSTEKGRADDLTEFQNVRLTRVTGLPPGASTPVIAFFVVLLVVSGLVLVIASVNVASMLLARAVARRREIAVRIALGAGRARLIRQLLTESVILFVVGGALGLAIAYEATRLLARIPLPMDVALAIDPTPDVRVLAVTLVVALLTGIAFGLAPALQGSRGDVAAQLRGDATGSTPTRARLRNVLVGAQVAASFLLLTTSGLFVRALSNGQRVDPGYDIGQVATASFDVGLSGYDTTRARAFYATLRERVHELPNVVGVSFTRVLPLSTNNEGYGLTVPGYRGKETFSLGTLVGPEFFSTMSLPLDAGRAILTTDDARAPQVAVVSREFVRTFWPGENPLGRTLKLDSTTVTVVGIVRDVKFSRLDEELKPFIYLAAAQHRQSDRNLLVRTTGDPAALAGPIRDIVRSIDATLPEPATVTLRRASVTALLPQRFAAMVTSALGLTGLILAAIGLYGVLSFSTAQRTREMGVRMALGADRRDVLRLVVGEGMRVVAAGTVSGLVLALVATRALAPFLFGVNPLDLTTYGAMTLILTLAAAAACLLPARRAASADPMAALREG